MSEITPFLSSTSFNSDDAPLLYKRLIPNPLIKNKEYKKESILLLFYKNTIKTLENTFKNTGCDK